MWTREELKIRAKNVLRGCFWSAVVVALITGILTGSFSSSRSNVQNAREINYNEIQSGGESLVDSATQMITGSGHQTENLLARVAGMSFGLVFLGVGISVMLLGLAFGILVGSPIEVGASRFFMRTREESTGMGELFWAFRQGQFWHIVLIMLVMKVKIFLCCSHRRSRSFHPGRSFQEASRFLPAALYTPFLHFPAPFSHPVRKLRSSPAPLR